MTPDIKDTPQNTTTVVFTGWIPQNPGNPSHLKASMEAFLRGKGVPTEQTWIDGVPQHPLTAEIISD